MFYRACHLKRNPTIPCYCVQKWNRKYIRLRVPDPSTALLIASSSSSSGTEYGCKNSILLLVWCGTGPFVQYTCSTCHTLLVLSILSWLEIARKFNWATRKFIYYHVDLTSLHCHNLTSEVKIYLTTLCRWFLLKFKVSPVGQKCFVSYGTWTFIVILSQSHR